MDADAASLAPDAASLAPDVSIIVVNYRSAGLTARALDAARRSAGPYTLEEIVVDNASGPGEVELLRSELLGATLIALPQNRGFAAGNNVGIERTRGRYLLLLNPDAFADGNALEQLARHLDTHPEAGLAAPRLENEDRSAQPNFYPRFPTLRTLFANFCYPLALLDVRARKRLAQAALSQSAWLPIAHATGAALLVRADAARATGPMDERFFLYLEETEWQRRMAATGWRGHGLPSACFVHLGGGGSRISSPDYVDSAVLFFGDRMVVETTIAVAAASSWLFLRALRALGRSSPGRDELGAGFATLLRSLRARQRGRDELGAGFATLLRSLLARQRRRRAGRGPR